MLALHQGRVIGADAAGAIYDGSYSENTETGGADIVVTLRAPAGTWLVQTGIPSPVPVELPIVVHIPLDFESRTLLVQTPVGPVNVAIKKLRDLRD